MIKAKLNDKLLNYESIELVGTCCGVMAKNLKGKTTAQMREILHIENDLTEAEEARIRKERFWCKLK